MLDLIDYWRDHPPVHEMVAAFLGVKPRPAMSAASAADPSGIADMILKNPNGYVTANHP